MPVITKRKSGILSISLSQAFFVEGRGRRGNRYQPVDIETVVTCRRICSVSGIGTGDISMGCLQSLNPYTITDGRLSIRAIALDLNPRANVDQLINFLLTSGLVRKCANGKYLPTTEIGAISQSDQFVAEHVAKSIVRFVGTVRRNAEKGVVGQSLIERFAYVSDLNPEEMDGFSEFTRSQGHAYLQVVDDWMEQRRVKSRDVANGKTKKGVLAGLHIIAYMDSGSGPGRSRSVRAAKGSEGSDGGGPTLGR